MKLKAKFFCDDVRYELGNKITAAGMYNDAIVFGPGAGGMAIPKLATVFVIEGLRGISELHVKYLVNFAGRDVTGTQEPSEVAFSRDAATDEQNFVFQQVPAYFPDEGILTSHLALSTKNGEASFECSIAIRRGPAATFVPPSQGTN